MGVTLISERVDEVLRQGVSPVCATCNKFWLARENGVPFPSCLVEKPCGSPISGDTFTHYEGPLTDFDRFCFICARDSDQVVSLAGKERKLGICRDHVVLLGQLEAQYKTEVLILVGAGGRESPLIQLSPRKKGLFQAIAETEAEFQAEEQRKSG